MNLLSTAEILLEDFHACEQTGEYICQQAPGLKFPTLSDVQNFLNSRYNEEVNPWAPSQFQMNSSRMRSKRF